MLRIAWLYMLVCKWYMDASESWERACSTAKRQRTTFSARRIWKYSYSWVAHTHTTGDVWSWYGMKVAIVAKQQNSNSVALSISHIQFKSANTHSIWAKFFWNLQFSLPLHHSKCQSKTKNILFSILSRECSMRNLKIIFFRSRSTIQHIQLFMCVITSCTCGASSQANQTPAHRAIVEGIQWLLLYGTQSVSRVCTDAVGVVAGALIHSHACLLDTPTNSIHTHTHNNMAMSRHRVERDTIAVKNCRATVSPVKVTVARIIWPETPGHK